MLTAVPGLTGLKAARKRLGLNQETLAEQLGVEQSAVSRWETNRSVPETPTLLRLAVLIRMPVEDLVVGVDAGYDKWRRDLLRHPGGHTSSTPGGNPDAAELDRLRIKYRQLREQVKQLGATAYSIYSATESTTLRSGRRKAG